MPEPAVTEQSLYPTMNTLEEAREYIIAHLPFTHPNDMHAALMLFQNTLLHVLDKE